MRKTLWPLMLLSVTAMLLQVNAVLGQESPAPAATKAPIVVHIENFAFTPGELTVHVGDSVEFVNDDDVAHTVTAKDKSFDSKNIGAHAKWTYTFTQPGTYAYLCSYHPGMSGSVTVTPAN